MARTAPARLKSKPNQVRTSSTVTPTSSFAIPRLTRLLGGKQGVAPPYHKNDFGYTIGGPVYIPGGYNRNKSKTFFFWSQEWRKERVPFTFNQLVPTAAERGGNFSDVC